MYASTAALDHIEKTAFQGDVKRKEREAKERQAEGQLLDSVYQVRHAGTSGMHASCDMGRVASLL